MDWLGLYGAVLSTLITIIGGIRWLLSHNRKQKEKGKFSTHLELLRKIDSKTKNVFPVVVITIANLGSERMSFKSVEYSGFAEQGGTMTGSAGWYEEPEAAMGIRKRLLPVVLESGQIAELPLLSIGFLKELMI